MPDVSGDGLPKRSIVALWFLVAYNPFRYFFERYLYGEMIAKAVVVFDQGSVAGWTVRHLDTPLLIALTSWTRLSPPWPTRPVSAAGREVANLSVVILKFLLGVRGWNIELMFPLCSKIGPWS